MRNKQQISSNRLGMAGQGQFYLLPCLPPPDFLTDKDLINHGWIIEKTQNKKFFLDRQGNRFSFKQASKLSGHYDLDQCFIDSKLENFDKKLFKKLNSILKNNKT